MKQTIMFGDFCDSFSEDRKNTFSYEGKKALFNYLEQYEEETGEELELDPIALCCEYSEYNSAYEAMKEYQPDDMPMMGEEGDDLTEIAEKNEAEALSWLQDRTMVIEVEGGGVIIAQF
jgi:hypothetical protein